MSADADEIRARVRERWTAQAPGWVRRRDALSRVAAPVSAWLLDAARLAPGQRVLELGCGPGDVGFLAAERVAPGGGVVMSDASEAMVDAARARGEELGVANVTYAVLDAEWIDASTASFDAVLSRWGLMFPLNSEAAFGECRRVLRPGGRLPLAAWTGPEGNPALSPPRRQLVGQGPVGAPPPDPPRPLPLPAPGPLG